MICSYTSSFKFFIVFLETAAVTSCPRDAGLLRNKAAMLKDVRDSMYIWQPWQFSYRSDSNSGYTSYAYQRSAVVSECKSSYISGHQFKICYDFFLPKEIYSHSASNYRISGSYVLSCILKRRQCF